MADVALWLNNISDHALLDYCAEQFGVSACQEKPSDSAYILEFSNAGVQLHALEQSHFKPLKIDFTLGGAAHRRKFGGGAGQLIAKAVGLSGQLTPHVFDATAGLGGDAFVLACLGCNVTLMERSPIAYVLLADALARAEQHAQFQDEELLSIVRRMQLIPGNSIEYLTSTQQFYPVVYLDPMFPQRQKQAAVKKEMQLFHSLVGRDEDSSELFIQAQKRTWCRTVVKRPRLAPTLTHEKPSLVLEGKSCRFDIYTKRKISIDSLLESSINTN